MFLRSILNLPWTHTLHKLSWESENIYSMCQIRVLSGGTTEIASFLFSVWFSQDSASLTPSHWWTGAGKSKIEVSCPSKSWGQVASWDVEVTKLPHAPWLSLLPVSPALAAQPIWGLASTGLVHTWWFNPITVLPQLPGLCPTMAGHWMGPTATGGSNGPALAFNLIILRCTTMWKVDN